MRDKFDHRLDGYYSIPDKSHTNLLYIIQFKFKILLFNYNTDQYYNSSRPKNLKYLGT